MAGNTEHSAETGSSPSPNLLRLFGGLRQGNYAFFSLQLVFRPH